MEHKTFIPGSEWVYFKLYTGTKTADAILKNEIYGYIRELLENGIIDRWFFIRYTDPDFHIRLRLHLKDTRDFSDVFNRFYAYFHPMVDAGLVWDIRCDTYQREMERYGYNTISLVEDLFFIDSEFAVKLLHQLNEDNPEQHRWKLALVLIDGLLSSFSLNIQQRKDLLNTLAENFKKEFGLVHHNVTKQLNDKYRSYRKEVEITMLWENEETETIEIIKRRKQVMTTVATKLTDMEKIGELKVPINSLLTSIIHMTMNRWFRTKNRLHELVIYEFLARYYTGEIAKVKYKQSSDETK